MDRQQYIEAVCCNSQFELHRNVLAFFLTRSIVSNLIDSTSPHSNNAGVKKNAKRLTELN